MWAPSRYHLWHQRMSETMPLNSLDQRLAYASSHGIAYVVDACQDHTEELAWKSAGAEAGRGPDGRGCAAPGLGVSRGH